MTTNYMSNYSYGPDCFKEIPEVLDKYKVHKVVFIGGEKALKSSQADIKSILDTMMIVLNHKGATASDGDSRGEFIGMASADDLMTDSEGNYMKIKK